MGRLERLARERHERDLALCRQPGGHPRGFRFDAGAADRAQQFVEGFCRHYKGEWAGKPLILEDAEAFCLRTIFGWKRADGTRRFRRAWIEVAKKNWKTTFASAVGLYLLVADGEAGGEVYVTATKRDQAFICHKSAREMVLASPALSRFVKVPEAEKAPLVCGRLRSSMAMLTSDHKTQDGWSPSGDIRDEVHEWADANLASKLDTASAARRQPLTLEITTAGVYDPESVGWTRHEYCVSILEGVIEDDRQFVFIAAIDEDDDWQDLECRAEGPNHTHPKCVVRKANPNLGQSPKLDFINEQIKEAESNPRKVNDVLRYHLNRWTNQATRWLNLERWKKAEAHALAGEHLLEGRTCFGGLDLSSILDLTAFVLLFPPEEEGGWFDLIARFWLPETTISEALKKDRAYFDQWRKEGWLIATPGDVIDYKWIKREVASLSQRFQVLEIGYDRYNATQVTLEMADELGLPMVEVSQGIAKLSEPSKLFEAKVKEARIRSTGPPGGPNPIMRWNVANAVARTDANGNIAPEKNPKKTKGKIDGVSAAVNALSRYIAAQEHSGSYLEREDPITL